MKTKNSRPKRSAWRLSSSALLRGLASNGFCRVIFGIFLFEAVWIAISGAYSMAFDEYFHFGIIKLYSHQLSPLLGHQPDGPAIYGAVARDPSYLYHYLMSFPYRLFADITASQTAQIIFLRLIDVGLFMTGMIIFRKLFREAKVPPLLSNIVLLFFVLLPVTSFIASQINYDNLLFLVTGLSMYLAVRLTNEIREHTHIPLLRAFTLFAVLLLGSIVKYAFLPIALGVGIYLLLSIYREIGFHRLKLWPALAQGSRGLKSVRGIVICLLLVVSMGLFSERYVVNTFEYHTPTPECDVVLDVDTCRAYDPFARNQSYKDADDKALISHKDIVTYPFTWLHGMMRSIFFVVGPKQLSYPAGEPLPIAMDAGYVAGILGLVALIWRARALWRQSHAYQLFMIVIIVYLLVLFMQNLSDYLSLGVPVAIQGRYTVPVLLLGFILVAVAARDMLQQVPQAIKVGTVIVLGLLMLEGGSIEPFVIRSSDEWMWPHSVTQHINYDTRKILWPIVFRGK